MQEAAFQEASGSISGWFDAQDRDTDTEPLCMVDVTISVRMCVYSSLSNQKVEKALDKCTFAI